MEVGVVGWADKSRPVGMRTRDASRPMSAEGGARFLAREPRDLKEVERHPPEEHALQW